VLTTFQQKEYYAQRGDFTIECWVYPTNPANGTYQYFGSAEGNPYFQIGLASNGKFVFAKGYFSDLVQSVSAATANTWYHVAITRYGSTCTLWVNGVSQGTATDSSACTITGTNPYSVGALWSGGSILYEFSGYMNDFRYTRGIARYTSNFTPPTTAFLTL
jgi:Concanavalin A-like lectin/glucanases superfamily